jgi:ABC-type phosphate transport system substrate-binding protein
MTGIDMKQIKSALLIVAALLTITPPSYAELVIIVNPQNEIKSMSASQAAQYYLGGSVQFTPLEQANGSPIRLEFYKKVLEKEPSQVQAIWARIVFTGKGKPPKEYKSSDDIKKAIRENVNAIGYIEKSAVDDSVKVIASIL